MNFDERQYADFAYYYDYLMSDIDYNAWGGYIDKIIKKYGVLYTDVLEIACGTGNIAICMAKKGYDITAFDLSEDMLSIASNKIIDSEVEVKLLYQDMRDIKINDDFGIILCLCDSINYITDENELKSIFIWVFNHLKPGGLFIFDINSAYKLEKIIGNNTFTYNKDELAYIWDNYISDEGTVEFYLTFFTKEGSLFRRFDEFHVEKIYETLDISGYLENIGFEKIDVYDGFTFDKPDEESERINFVIKKN